MLENSGRGLGKKIKKHGIPKGHIRDGESSWWPNHNRRENTAKKKCIGDEYSKGNILE
jgi:hypothetical protein